MAASWLLSPEDEAESFDVFSIVAQAGLAVVQAAKEDLLNGEDSGKQWDATKTSGNLVLWLLAFWVSVYPSLWMPVAYGEGQLLLSWSLELPGAWRDSLEFEAMAAVDILSDDEDEMLCPPQAAEAAEATPEVRAAAESSRETSRSLHS